MDLWKQLNPAGQQNGVEDNQKMNGSIGALAGLYGLDSYSLIPGTPLRSCIPLNSLYIPPALFTLAVSSTRCYECFV